jgi:hypothetical protein
MILSRDRPSLTLAGKLALGFTHEVVDRQGTTVFFGPGGATSVPNGFLVHPTNAGRDTRGGPGGVGMAVVGSLSDLTVMASARSTPGTGLGG